MKTTHVLGLMFSYDGNRVALIRKKTKNKPGMKFMDGLLNGIGGGVEEGETAIDAMVREFREETGRNTLPEDWRLFCTLDVPKTGVRVMCFTGFGDVDVLRTTTEEEVVIADLNEDLPFFRTVRNLRWMIPLALDADKPTAFVIDES